MGTCCNPDSLGTCSSQAAHEGHTHSAAPIKRKLENISIVIAGCLITTGFFVEHFTAYSQRTAHFIYFFVMLMAGWFLIPKAVKALFKLRPDIDLLVVTASIGAVFLNEYAEAAIVVFLFGIAEWLESFASTRARRAISSLLDLSPVVARVQRGKQGFIEIPVEEAQVGDIFQVRPGERIPLDGFVVSGVSSVDQSSITGESIPVDKNQNDSVYAGTINGESILEIQATKLYSNSTLARIIRQVEEAQGQRAPTQKFIERFARYYTPAIIFIALLVFTLPVLFANGNAANWAYRALTLLIVACPCALVISTPVSIASSITALARKGILTKGGVYVELIGKLQALAVDKTGTVSEGRPKVQRIIPLENQKTEEEILGIAASLSLHSNHPLSQAVVAYAQQKSIPYASVEDFRSITGRGVEGKIEGHNYFMGNHRLAHELGICTPELEAKLVELETHAQSILVVGHMPHHNCSGEPIAILALADTIRPQARSAFEKLKRKGIQKVIMLSGDNQRTVDAIAQQAGIDEAFGELLPEDKVERIKKLKEAYPVIGMVGDGVNDAPSLATATIGIAMGDVGSDTAIETADITLMRGDLNQIADAVQLGRRTLRVIQFNIGFSILLKLIFIILTVLGYTSLWLAIAADMGATLIVTLNALRLLQNLPEKKLN